MQRILPFSLYFFLVAVFPCLSLAQPGFYDSYEFTGADTLRGMLRPERSCYDVTFYELDITVDPAQQSLQGYVDIHYRALTAFRRLQIDL